MSIVGEQSLANSSHHNPYHVSGQSPTEVDRYSFHSSDNKPCDEISQSDIIHNQNETDSIRDQRTTTTATLGEDTGTRTSTTNASSDKSKITATETETPGRKTVTVTEHVTK